MKKYYIKKYDKIHRIMVSEGLEHLLDKHPELVVSVDYECPICEDIHSLDLTDYPEEGEILKCENYEELFIVTYIKEIKVVE